MKKSKLKLLSSTAFVAMTLFAFTFIQTYWSMGKLADQTSSGCLDCSFIYDACLISLCNAIILSLLFLLIAKIKRNRYQIAVEFVLLTSFWFFWNYNIFVDRESSWSTYSFDEEIYYTVYLSLLPVLVTATLTLMTIHHQVIRSKFRGQKKVTSTTP
ncbi:hypothetical protein [Sphingobacterium sp. UDSM-2020]|uniref:hypothetical protein n=1 Tax=Sphingobacterium sp. UDSM-2020 TaxID=2795738 RepID=UPI0019372DCC|nr:hypothetical protein [Sphingobacterium sp. UDSM-2020]QQD16077.1 hypothetical protein JAZ75_11385 [Sphingobacterium sp. UDSM-2020]